MGTTITGATVYVNKRRKRIHYEICWIRAVTDGVSTPFEANWHGTCDNRTGYMAEITRKVHVKFPDIRIVFVSD